MGLAAERSITGVKMPLTELVAIPENDTAGETPTLDRAYGMAYPKLS